MARLNIKHPKPICFVDFFFHSITIMDTLN